MARKKEADEFYRFDAETLRLLNKLGVSREIKEQLHSDWISSVDEILKTWRSHAFNREIYGIKMDGWQKEFISILKDAGYIRPAKDFAITLCIKALYGEIFWDWKKSFETDIYYFTRKQYEEFQSIPKRQVKEVKNALQKILNDELQYEIVCYHFGLDGSGKLGMKRKESTTAHFNISTLDIDNIIRAIARQKYELPTIFDAPKAAEEKANSLFNELQYIWESPVYKRANAIVDELDKMKELPFKFDCGYLKPGGLDKRPIEELRLEYHTLKYLYAAGIRTIADVINYPKDKWYKTWQIGSKSLLDVEEKMHLIGYKDFTVAQK